MFCLEVTVPAWKSAKQPLSPGTGSPLTRCGLKGDPTVGPATRGGHHITSDTKDPGTRRRSSHGHSGLRHRLHGGVQAGSAFLRLSFFDLKSATMADLAFGHYEVNV